MCGPHRRFAPLLPRTLRRIPQAVGVVATLKSMFVLAKQNLSSFNTASGKYCYFVTFVLPSHRRFAPLLPHTLRRIPQAVGVIATVQKAAIL